jgi:hypothetical protein
LLGWSIPSRHEEQRIAAQRGAAANRSQARHFASNVQPIIGSVRAAGVRTLAGIANALNARGISTARGGRWHPATVRRLMARDQIDNVNSPQFDVSERR